MYYIVFPFFFFFFFFLVLQNVMDVFVFIVLVASCGRDDTCHMSVLQLVWKIVSHNLTQFSSACFSHTCTLSHTPHTPEVLRHHYEASSCKKDLFPFWQSSTSETCSFLRQKGHITCMCTIPFTFASRLPSCPDRPPFIHWPCVGVEEHFPTTCTWCQ